MGLVTKRNLIFITTIVNILILFGMTFYLLFGPSFYVVGGDSMEHIRSPQFGLIDFKDGIIVTPIGVDEDIVTYFEGRELDYRTFGDYGDVISFEMRDVPFPISHRVVCFVKYNFTQPNITVDIPELDLFGVRNVTFKDVGIRNHTFHVDFSGLYEGLLRKDIVVEEGYLTKGDNREYPDQRGKELIANNSIMGKVEVVDNELIVMVPLEYIFIVSVIMVIVVSNFSDIMFREKDIDKAKMKISQEASVMVLFGYVFYKDLFMIFNTTGYDLSDEMVLVSYTIVIATIPVILTFFSSKILNGKDEKVCRMIPLIIVGAFILYFLVAAFVSLRFLYSLVAYSFAVSLLFLGPMRYFQDQCGMSEKEKSGWLFLFVFEIFALIMMINMTLPFYSLLIIGMIFVDFHFVSLYKNI